MNGVKVDVHAQNGATRTLKQNTIDPLQEGVWTPGDHPRATIGFTAGKAVGYGELKLSVHVTLQCDQTEAAVEQAATKAFEKAVHYLAAGFTMLAEAGKNG